MKKLFVGAALIWATALPAFGQAKAPKQPQKHVQVQSVPARPEDVASIEAIVKASYETISGGVGVPRQFRDARCNTGNNACHVVMAARRIVNRILAAARRSAFQGCELINQTPIIQQANRPLIQFRQQIRVERVFSLLARLVLNPALAECLPQPFARVTIAGHSPQSSRVLGAYC